MNRVVEFLTHEAQQISAEFSKASLTGRGTPQEVADFRENYFQKFIARYFPFPHRVAKGIIIDSYGRSSASIDCVVTNPNHPYIIDANGKFSLLLADGVDVAIEIKPDLSDSTQLLRGLEQVITLKKLRRRESSIVSVGQNVDNEIIELSKTVPAFLFALKAKSSAEETAQEIADFYCEHNIPVIDQVDNVVIHNTCIISNYKNIRLSKSQEHTTGIHIEGWGDKTLAAFLLKLNEAFHAEAQIGRSPLMHYIAGINPETFGRITPNYK